MKKIICFLLMTAVLLCAFVSCGKKPASKESSSVVEPENGKSFGKTLETKRLYRPLEAGKYRAVLYLEDGSVRYAEFDVK